MDAKQANIILRRLYYDYNNLDEDDPLAIKIDNEIEYYEHIKEGTIICSWHPLEGCEKCRYIKECDHRV